MSPFEFKEYKSFVRWKIDGNRGIRGYQSQLARAAGCSRSFLSQVLGRDIDLTRDHAAGLGEFWSLDPLQFEYFLTLVDLSRVRSEHLRNHLERKLARIRGDHSNLSKRLGKEAIDGARAELIYYSSWTYGAIHMLLCVP